ncbi:MAG: lipopolysaccharide heptosyltransferase II, partial [Candidatus Omnitrophica bacterium]|nr:lipopolysaccharide heptosyltransferase II [Candidatus Omnitrophota bacterium]
LNAKKFDLVVDLRNTAFGRFLSVKYRVLPPFRKYGQHMRERHLSGLISFLGKGKVSHIKQGLYIDHAHREYINKILEENDIGKDEDIIVISPGARSHIKRWTEGGFIELCDRLRQDLGFKVVLVGDEQDKPLVQRIKERTINPLVDLCSRTNIAQLTALLERAKLLVTNDSAVLHLGSYFNMPVVAIFGPTDEKKYGPWSEKSIVVKKDIFCRPCEKAQCRFGTLDCMKLIKTEDVLRAIKQVLTPSLIHPLIPRHDFKRILIARTDRIGDVLLSTPVIKALRDAYPAAYIAMIVSPYAREIVEGNPYLDEVLIYDKEHKHRSWRNSKKFAQELKRKYFDLALILHPTNRMHLVTFFAGIKRRIGYDRRLSFLLTDRIKHTKHLGEKHEMEYALDFVRYLGKEPKEKNLYMPIKKEAEIWADNLLKENGITKDNRLIVINPTASCPSKVWPPERFAEVANRLILEYQAKIVIIASQKDKALAQSTIRNIHSLIIDLTGKTSLSQLASLLKRAHLFISNDSGPVHIASSVGTPVISIFGRSQKGLGPVRWGPLGKRDIFLHKPVGCIECLAHNCVKDFACLKAITTEDVLRVAKTILRGEK